MTVWCNEYSMANDGKDYIILALLYVYFDKSLNDNEALQSIFN